MILFIKTNIRIFSAIFCIAVMTLLLTPEMNPWARGLNPYHLQILMAVGINAILAVSLTLINGITGQFSIGHAAFAAIGAYASGFFSLSLAERLIGPMTQMGVPAFVSGNLWILLALIVGGIAASVAGLIVGMPTLRLHGDYLAIATLGFGEIVRVFIQNQKYLGASTGMSVRPNEVGLFWIYLILIFCVVTVYRISRGPRGLSFSAVREDEIASVSIGINPTRYKVAAFTVGAFFAGVAGALTAHQIGYINPSSFGFIKSFELVVMIVLGGLGSITGAIIGAVVLTVLPELLRASSEYRLVIYAILLIVLMLLRPQGIFGRHELTLRKLFFWKKGGGR